MYTSLFRKSRDLQYDLEPTRIEIYQNAVDARARYQVDQILKRSGREKVWKGEIRWILIKEDAIQVIGGPAQAIANQTTVYAEITPGDLKSGRLANRIKQVLVKKVPKPLRKKIFELPLEEIQRFIPYGRGRLKR